MTWRDVLVNIWKEEGYANHADAIAEGVAETLLSMPPADRIALARELLAGTEMVVAREFGKRLHCRILRKGFGNEFCRSNCFA